MMNCVDKKNKYLFWFIKVCHVHRLISQKKNNVWKYKKCNNIVINLYS